MKTLILSLIFVLCGTVSNAQKIYKCVMTEMYTWTDYNKEWDLYQKNSDTKIDVCMEDEYITIFANSPTMFKILRNTKEPISFGKYAGHRYVAKDLKLDIMVAIDIAGNTDEGVFMISVMNKQDRYNLRYFLNL